MDYEGALIFNFSPVRKMVQICSFRNVYQTLTRWLWYCDEQNKLHICWVPKPGGLCSDQEGGITGQDVDDGSEKEGIDKEDEEGKIAYLVTDWIQGRIDEPLQCWHTADFTDEEMTV